jgi:uncharacterized membrane protein YphA (DoxX/SURF4 family)
MSTAASRVGQMGSFTRSVHGASPLQVAAIFGVALTGAQITAVRDDSDGFGRHGLPQMNELLLILRLALAVYLVAGAIVKLRNAGQAPQLAIGAVELGAGVLLGLGLFMPLVATLLVAVTANLAFTSWPHEYPLYLVFAAVAIALAGAGVYSLDDALLAGSAGAPGSLGVVGGLAGAVAMEGRRKLLREEHDVVLREEHDAG